RSEGRRFRTGRAVVPVSAFYEFTGARYPKTRWTFRAGPGLGEAPFLCLAAIWRPAQDDWPASFSLLTAAPGPDVAPYHDRGVIPVPPEGWAAWLDPQTEAPEALLTPPPAGTPTVAEAPRGAHLDALWGPPKFSPGGAGERASRKLRRRMRAEPSHPCRPGELGRPMTLLLAGGLVMRSYDFAPLT